MSENFRPIQALDPQGRVIGHIALDDKMRTSKYDNSSITIVGYAAPKTLETEAKWKIFKYTFDASGNAVEKNDASDGSNILGGYNLVWKSSTPTNITAATKANPCNVTSVDHGLSTNDFVEIVGVNGMTDLNSDGYGSKVYKVTRIDKDNVTLADVDGNAIDSSGYGAYTNSGTIDKKDYLNYSWS